MRLRLSRAVNARTVGRSGAALARDGGDAGHVPVRLRCTCDGVDMRVWRGAGTCLSDAGGGAGCAVDLREGHGGTRRGG